MSTTVSMMNEIASKSLGDSTSYAVFTDVYDPSLLNVLPRNIVRDEEGYIDSPLGFDVWHCYEATFLRCDGRPVSGIMKIVYPSCSKNMIESKSLKLFLNTFDMCKFNSSDDYRDVVNKCLSDVLPDVVVSVSFTEADELCEGDSPYDKFGVEMYPRISSCAYYTISLDDCEITSEPLVYDATYKMKSVTATVMKEERTYTFSSLRSRCRHTKQKDSGCAYIKVTGDAHINDEELYRLLVSLREHNEFHEFCCEKVYTAIKTLLSEHGYHDSLVTVAMNYARRGSLDINPVRSDDPHDFYTTRYVGMNCIYKMTASQ